MEKNPWNLWGLVGHGLEVIVRSEETNMMKQFQKSRKKEKKRKERKKKEERKKKKKKKKKERKKKKEERKKERKKKKKEKKERKKERKHVGWRRRRKNKVRKKERSGWDRRKKEGKKEDKWKVKKNEKHNQLSVIYILNYYYFCGIFFFFMSVYIKQIDNTPKCTEKKKMHLSRLTWAWPLPVRVLSLRASVIHGFVTEPWHSRHVLFSHECAASSVLSRLLALFHVGAWCCTQFVF